jgi:hypothetical protein
MNETLTFILNLKEMMSGGMAKIASTAQSVFGGVDKRIANTQRQFSMAGRSISELNNRLALLTQKRDLSIGIADIAKANREIEQLERRVNKMQTKGRGDSFSKGGGGMHLPWWMSGAMIGGMAIAGIGSMIKVGADQQRDVVGLSTFMGKDKAQGYYNQVQQDARVTPFVTHDLMAANRMLISTGMNADRARGDIMSLANAVAATGGSNYQLERMAQHLQMIRGMGHASYMQLKEFTTNGINIMQLLSDATGKHIKMAHGMTVSYGAIEKALAHAAEKGGLFYNALFAQSQTIWGKWSTLVDDLQVSAGKIVNSQSGAITGLLDLFDKYAQRLPEMADQWAAAITSITTGVVSMVGTLISLAKWVYHNWNWIKYLVVGFYAFKVAVWAATSITAIYNGVMSIAAIRATALAGAEMEAAVATGILDAALMALPWMIVGAGIAATIVGITALISKSKDAGNELTKNLKQGDRVLNPGMRLATESDYKAGKAHWEDGRSRGTRYGGYVFDEIDSWEADKAGFAKLHPKEKDNWVLHEIYKKAKAAHDIVLKSQMVIYDPKNSVAGVAASAKAMVPDKDEEGDGDGIKEKNAITGGGRKQIIINVKSFAEHFVVNAQNLQDAAKESKEYFMRCFLEVLESANSAM